MNEDTESVTAAPGPMAKVRPFYWSVRRELWENRSIYFAPLIAAGIVLFGRLLSAGRMIHVQASLPPGDGANLTWNGAPIGTGSALALPYDVAPMAIMATGIVVALFYCLNALHNERRDRSVLFWKSLPVSDLTTVLSKAVVPTLIVPAAIAGAVVATHLIMLLIDLASAMTQGRDVGGLLSDLDLGATWAKLIYALAALALWHAPVYAWLLLVSGWARRAPFLWAVLPPAAVGLVEGIAFNSNYTGNLLFGRLGGAFKVAFTNGEIDPIRLLTAPGLWAGLAVAAGFLAAAVWLRRYREPT